MSSASITAFIGCFPVGKRRSYHVPIMHHIDGSGFVDTCYIFGGAKGDAASIFVDRKSSSVMKT